MAAAAGWSSRSSGVGRRPRAPAARPGWCARDNCFSRVRGRARRGPAHALQHRLRHGVRLCRRPTRPAAAERASAPRRAPCPSPAVVRATWSSCDPAASAAAPAAAGAWAGHVRLTRSSRSFAPAAAARPAPAPRRPGRRAWIARRLRPRRGLRPFAGPPRLRRQRDPTALPRGSCRSPRRPCGRAVATTSHARRARRPAGGRARRAPPPRAAATAPWRVGRAPSPVGSDGAQRPSPAARLAPRGVWRRPPVRSPRCSPRRPAQASVAAGEAVRSKSAKK